MYNLVFASVDATLVWLYLRKLRKVQNDSGRYDKHTQSGLPASEEAWLGRCCGKSER